MTDMTPVPTVLIEALKVAVRHGEVGKATYAIIACLPKPSLTFSDGVCAAFYLAQSTNKYAIPDGGYAKVGRDRLTCLYESGWLTVADDGSFIITPPKETS